MDEICYVWLPLNFNHWSSTFSTWCIPPTVFWGHVKKVNEIIVFLVGPFRLEERFQLDLLWNWLGLLWKTIGSLRGGCELSGSLRHPFFWNGLTSIGEFYFSFNRKHLISSNIYLIIGLIRHETHPTIPAQNGANQLLLCPLTYELPCYP